MASAKITVRSPTFLTVFEVVTVCEKLSEGGAMGPAFNSRKQFEKRLDKFWRNHDVMFDWTAKITGTGDR